MKRHIESFDGSSQKLIFKPHVIDLLPTLRFAASAIITCFEAAAESLGNDEMQTFADGWSARQIKALGHSDK